MPTFNILLAADQSLYGDVKVSAETWQDAVQMLNLNAWYDACTHRGDSFDGLRVVHVEDEADEIVAEDINYDSPLVHSYSVVHRLRSLLVVHHDDLCALVDALGEYMVELEAVGRDPLFVEQDQKEDV